MNCNDRYDDLILYLDGELDPAAASEMKLHLEECEVCRQKLGALESVQSCLRDSLSELEQSPGITGSVLAGIPHQSGSKVWRWVTAAGLATATACLLVWLNLPLQHEAAKQGNHTDRVAIRTESRNPSPTPGPAALEQSLAGTSSIPDTPEVAQRLNKTRHLVVKRLCKSVNSAPEHLAKNQDKEPAAPVVATNNGNTIRVCIQPSTVTVHGQDISRSISMTVEACGTKVTQIREVVTVPPPPNQDAESIQRPELEIVSTSIYGRMSS